MAPLDKGGVVDSKMRVYGIEGLRVSGMLSPVTITRSSMSFSRCLGVPDHCLWTHSMCLYFVFMRFALILGRLDRF